jgi:methionyl-tRNA formyltransferase
MLNTELSQTEEIYYYAFGDRLTDRNTYFYTSYHGSEFFKYWEDARNSVLCNVSTSKAVLFNEPKFTVEHALLKLESVNGIESSTLFDTINSSLANNLVDDKVLTFLKMLVKKFEVSKRVFACYQGINFLIVDKNAYHDLMHYVKFASLMSDAYRQTGCLPFLNAFLKVLDSLCSRANELEHSVLAVLEDLFVQERQYIATLSTKLEIEI